MAEKRIVLSNCGKIDPRNIESYLTAGGFSAYQKARKMKPKAIVEEVKKSGLTGRGGAGFSCGLKWEMAMNARGREKYLICNADEGEVGAFKDKYIISHDPFGLIEGMLIAGLATGARTAFIYLRGEYHALDVLLKSAIEQAHSKGYLKDMDIRVFEGAGAYVCGEESAMIESIEGRRGMPRLRPPYVAQVGAFGRPTLVNNPETLMWVTAVLERGAPWYASHGRRGRRGLRSFSVSGRVRRPGVVLAPAGITLRELLDEHCGGMAEGHALYGFLPGGASGGILPAALADVPLDFDTLAEHGAFVGSCAVVVLSDRDRARDAAANLLRFFRHESCGQCTPCRVGTAKAEPLLAAPSWDAGLLGELSRAMRDASICGLGQAAPNPFDSVLRYFPHEVR